MAIDVADSLSRREAIRHRHLQYVRALIDEGRVLIAGPHPAIDSPDPGPAGMSGSLIVAEFESIKAAHAWAEADPYSREGIFESVTIKPFIKVYP